MVWYQLPLNDACIPRCGGRNGVMLQDVQYKSSIGVDHCSFSYSTLLSSGWIQSQEQTRTEVGYCI